MTSNALMTEYRRRTSKDILAAINEANDYFIKSRNNLIRLQLQKIIDDLSGVLLARGLQAARVNLCRACYDKIELINAYWTDYHGQCSNCGALVYDWRYIIVDKGALSVYDADNAGDGGDNAGDNAGDSGDS